MESNFGSPDGDHRRPAEAAVQRRREEGRSLTFFAVLVVLLPLIETVCLVSVLVDSGLLLMGRSPLQMGSLMRFLCIIGPLCQPTVQMLLYTFYNFLEEQAFNDFEVNCSYFLIIFNYKRHKFRQNKNYLLIFYHLEVQLIHSRGADVFKFLIKYSSSVIKINFFSFLALFYHL